MSGMPAPVPDGVGVGEAVLVGVGVGELVGLVDGVGLGVAEGASRLVWITSE